MPGGAASPGGGGGALEHQQSRRGLLLPLGEEVQLNVLSSRPSAEKPHQLAWNIGTFAPVSPPEQSLLVVLPPS